MAIGSGKVYFDNSTAYASGSLGKLYVDDGGEITVMSGGQVDVESGGGIDIESGGDLDVESGGHIDLASGGYLGVASGGWIAYPVVGCTSSYIAGSGTSDVAAIPSNAIVYALINGTSSRRHVDVAAPTAGAFLKIFVSPDVASSSGGIVFDMGSGVTVDSTNRYLFWASSGSTYISEAGDKAIELIGLSATRWLIMDRIPAPGG